MTQGWVGVDLDGTLAEYVGTWRGCDQIGAPVAAMVDRVKKWIAEGIDVRIFTARVAGPMGCHELAAACIAIEDWCREHIGSVIPINCTKDMHCVELWDDRAIRVITNTGEPVMPPPG